MIVLIMERRSEARRDLGLSRSKRPSFSSSKTIIRSDNSHSTMKKPQDIRYGGSKPESSENPLTSSSPIVGTCPDMCPARERAQRERLRDLSVFERLNGNPGRTSSSLAVKKFCRTMSNMNVQPSDVRPIQVLQETLAYLLTLLDSSEYPFELIHDFIFDRTRAIRQDLSMQNIVNDQAVSMHEEMVKFHIISHYRLPRCSSSPNISSLHHLNMEQLLKSLTSLYDLYEANRRSDSINKNEAEFYSFYVLLHLGSKNQPMGESLSLWFRRLAAPIIKAKEMCFARKVLSFFRIGNFKRFITTTASEASQLQHYLMEPFVAEVRLYALTCINHVGYKLHPYPVAHLSRLLMMKESDVESFCNACGLETSIDEVGNKLLPTKQTSLCRPKGGLPNYSLFDLERLQRPTDLITQGCKAK